MEAVNDNRPRLMAMKEAATATCLSRTTLQNLARDGAFPQPVPIGERRLAFVRAEVEQWIDERIATRAA